jgi:hypothetical protein
MTRRLKIFPSGEVYPARVFKEVSPSTVAFTTADQVGRSRVFRAQTRRLEKERRRRKDHENQ